MSVQKNNNIVQLLFSFGAGITFIHEKLTVWHSCNGSTVQRLKTNAAEGFFLHNTNIANISIHMQNMITF